MQRRLVVDNLLSTIEILKNPLRVEPVDERQKHGALDQMAVHGLGTIDPHAFA